MLEEIKHPFHNIRKGVKKIESKLPALESAREALENLPRISGIIFGASDEALRTIIRRQSALQSHLCPILRNLKAIDENCLSLKVSHYTIEITRMAIKKLQLQLLKTGEFLMKSSSTVDENPDIASRNVRRLKKNFRLYGKILYSSKISGDIMAEILESMKRFD